jgi:iron complex outermembrane receptor protein
MRLINRAVMLSTASALALSASLATSVRAQSPQQTAQAAPGLEEIVVTARKREEALLEIPISITAFTAADIERADVFDLREVTRLSPGMNFQNVGGNGPGGRYNPNLFFRGMTPTAPLPRQQTGAVFVDGVYVLGGVTSVNTVDVERVEVIKGPQSAYFGRNTFGGAVNFITQNPGDALKGKISAEAATRDSFDTSLSVEGPLIEGKLAARASVLLHKKGAHYTATDGGELGEEKTESVTGTLYATPSDNFWVRLRVHYQEDNDSPAATAHLSGGLHGSSCAGFTGQGRTGTGAPTTFTIGQPYFCGSIPKLTQLPRDVVSSNTSLASPLLASLGNPNALVNAFINNSLNNPLVRRAPRIDRFGMVREILRVNAQTEYTFANDIALGVNFGINTNDTNTITDPDRSDFENAYTTSPALFEDKTLEVRLTSAQTGAFRWLVGGNYYRGDFDAHTNGSVVYQVRQNPTLPQATAPFQNAPANRDGERARVSAAFGSIEYDVFDWMTLTGEIRYQKDKTKVQPSNPTSLTATFKDWLPRVIADFKLDPDTTLYASWSKGVLPGQFNPGYSTQTPFVRAQIEAAFPGVKDLLDSQRIESFEIGAKQQLLDNRLQYAVAGYYMKWRNLISGSAIVVQSVPNGPFVVNTGVLIPGSADLYGIEFESTAVLTDAWDVNLRFNYQGSELKTLFDPFIAGLTSGVTRFDGNEFARVPKWSGSLSSTYRADLTGDWDWFLRGDATYTGGMWESVANIVKTNDYIRVNARLGVERDDLALELFVKNLFDDKNWDYGFRSVSFREPGGALFVRLPNGTFNFQQGIIVQPPDKREFGVRLRYDF